MSNEAGKEFTAVMLDPRTLTPHPRNYRKHPMSQLRHIIDSIETHGFYRNVVVSKDLVILAGHGVTEAALEMGLAKIPVITMDIDAEDPRAIKLLTGDNEIANLSEVNDRLLTELLKEIMGEQDLGLTGTGFDAEQLASLVMVTRPISEIKDKNEAAEWVGMPDWEVEPAPIKLIVSFANESDRSEFARIVGYNLTEKTTSVWFPPRTRDDNAGLKFEG
jgi:hypothetical protein